MCHKKGKVGEMSEKEYRVVEVSESRFMVEWREQGRWAGDFGWKTVKGAAGRDRSWAYADSAVEWVKKRIAGDVLAATYPRQVGDVLR